MLVKLHANAATTPRVWAYIQARARPVAELARELGVCETTIRRWKRRSDGADRSSRPHAWPPAFPSKKKPSPSSCAPAWAGRSTTAWR
jgi:hypothetical protein